VAALPLGASAVWQAPVPEGIDMGPRKALT
jgi:hypothetical protein